MRNFQKIAQGINTAPLLHAIQRQPELWNTERLRTTFPGSPHAEVDDMLLRFNDLEPYNSLKLDKDSEFRKAKMALMDEHESLKYPAWDALPQAHDIIFDLMRFVRGVRLW